MTRRRGRPARQYNVRVRTQRRNPIDAEGLARAALEQAAIDNRENSGRKTQHRRRGRPHVSKRRKEHHHDDLE